MAPARGRLRRRGAGGGRTAALAAGAVAALFLFLATVAFLHWALADLEEERQAGRITETAYQRARRQLLRRR